MAEHPPPKKQNPNGEVATTISKTKNLKSQSATHELYNSSQSSGFLPWSLPSPLQKKKKETKESAKTALYTHQHTTSATEHKGPKPALPSQRSEWLKL
jgi:hypothetical protein